MTKYLLLRDNKQTGPYSMEEIRTKGLKAYDLVWVEGKSAAWRYPCEVEELSAFAPAVEEQPFDRFYKKPSQNQSIVSNASVTPANAHRETVNTAISSGESSIVPGKRIIYVTLPAAKGYNINNKEPQAMVNVPPAAVPVIEDNYAQEQASWKNDVEILPRIHKRNGWVRAGRSIVIAAGVLILLVAGIFIGMSLSLNKDAFEFAKGFSFAAFTKEKKPVRPIDHPSQALAVSRPAPTPPPVQEADIKGDTLQHVAAPAENRVTVPAPQVPLHKEKASKTRQTISVAARGDSSVLTIPAVRRESTHRTDMTSEKMDKDVVRNNLSNLVSLGANPYTIGTFGGISDLQLTVSNHSVYPLDLVVVEVLYIQANKKVFKTETLNFRGIAAGSALMLEAPPSTRGIKVEYKITQVSSKESGLSYSAL